MIKKHIYTTWTICIKFISHKYSHNVLLACYKNTKSEHKYVNSHKIPYICILFSKFIIRIGDCRTISTFSIHIWYIMISDRVVDSARISCAISAIHKFFLKKISSTPSFVIPQFSEYTDFRHFNLYLLLVLYTYLDIFPRTDRGVLISISSNFVALLKSIYIIQGAFQSKQ